MNISYTTRCDGSYRAIRAATIDIMENWSVCNRHLSVTPDNTGKKIFRTSCIHISLTSAKDVAECNATLLSYSDGASCHTDMRIELYDTILTTTIDGAPDDGVSADGHISLAG